MTDGPISGAVGPSPEHCGAPAEGEGCNAEWEGATHMGMWGLPRMENTVHHVTSVEDRIRKKVVIQNNQGSACPWGL